MAITLYACAGEQPLARAIAKNLNSELEQILVRTFPDGESHVRVEAMDRVAGQDIAIVWPLDRPDDKVLPLWFA
jgi:ribose-phosphate pyrophosphokinase